MKNLKNYIKDYLNESVWDIEDNVEDDNKELILNDIKKFIKDNYYPVVINRCEFVFDEEKEKFIVSYNKSASGIKLRSGAKSIVNDLFEWGTVGWWFDCSGCDNLTTLQGVPKRVERSFDCNNCPKLESLQGAPEYVGGNFDCSYCPKLTTLEGAPETVGGEFNCRGCIELKSLKGAPKRVDGDFDCQRCPNLHSLDGIGKVRGRIDSNIIDSNIGSK